MIISRKSTVSYQRCDSIARAYDVRFGKKKKTQNEVPILSSWLHYMCLILAALTEYKWLYYPSLVLVNLLVLDLYLETFCFTDNFIISN